MPVISSKRQVTLPISQCEEIGIKPGDEYVSYVDNHGHITIIKKTPNAAEGLLSGTEVDDRFTDEDSLQDGMIQ